MDSIQMIFGLSATSTSSLPVPGAPTGQNALSRCCGTPDAVPQDGMTALLQLQAKIMKQMLRILMKLMKGQQGKGRQRSSEAGSGAEAGRSTATGAAGDIPAKYRNNPMAQLIWEEAKKAGADPYVMLATAIVESGLNPRAVGDNGTSFGLYQYHIGGALGNRSKEWAFDPGNITQDEARRFASAGVHDGRGAAAVQRPADPAGYAAKVDAIIAELKRG